MRAIVRISLNDDTGSALRNQFAPILEGVGLTRISTATWEGDVDEGDLRRAMSRFWNTLANHTGPAHLDHFWMYVDSPAT